MLLPGKFHGWRRLVGCSPCGREESDTTERLHFHFSLSCTGEGNGSPLQCSCLESPRGGGAWWAAVYGVAQSRARLKRLSSSSHLPFGHLCPCPSSLGRVSVFLFQSELPPHPMLHPLLGIIFPCWEFLCLYFDYVFSRVCVRSVGVFCWWCGGITVRSPRSA